MALHEIEETGPRLPLEDAVEAVLRQRLKAGAGILFVTHDEAQAGRLAERCLRLAAGTVTAGVL